MPDLQQPPTIRCGQRMDGKNSEYVPKETSPSPLRETKGDRFKSLEIIDSTVYKKSNSSDYSCYLLCKCTSCGREGMRNRSSLRKGTAGCRYCNVDVSSAPLWLHKRCIGVKQRCTNPNNPRWERYGGRGILFLFNSPKHMAMWIQENLGLHQEMQIDRIDNDGHYEPGNLRWSTPAQNMENTERNKFAARFHAFKINHPEILYADATLRRLMWEGLTDAEIIKRFNQPSYKPKGVYGTYSTPDPIIASRWKTS